MAPSFVKTKSCRERERTGCVRRNSAFGSSDFEGPTQSQMVVGVGPAASALRSRYFGRLSIKLAILNLSLFSFLSLCFGNPPSSSNIPLLHVLPLMDDKRDDVNVPHSARLEHGSTSSNNSILSSEQARRRPTGCHPLRN